jgi:hypothetical protein
MMRARLFEHGCSKPSRLTASWPCGQTSSRLRAPLACLKPQSFEDNLLANFDFDLARVTETHYITGKAAINFPWPGSTTGGWHVLGYWDRDAGQVKVSLAGIHYPDTSFLFGTTGVLDAREELAKRGWHLDSAIYMADHFRAAADMVIAWAMGRNEHCNVELAEWFAAHQDHVRIVLLLKLALDKLGSTEQDRLIHWLKRQSVYK